MSVLRITQFIQTVLPHVLRVHQEGAVLLPSVRIAQSILETGGVVHEWFNLGGIKVGNGIKNAYWHGDVIQKPTWEVFNGRQVSVVAAFRSYSSLYHYYKDQDLFLSGKRYARVKQATTAEGQAMMLQACGYATDPAYARKLIRIITQYDLLIHDPQLAKASDFFKNAGKAKVYYMNDFICTGHLVKGVVWVPARTLSQSIKVRVGWDGKAVTLDKQPVSTQLDKTVGYVPIREFAKHTGLSIAWSTEHKTVTLAHAKTAR